MNTSTTRFLLLVLACCFNMLCYSQVTTSIKTPEQVNYTTFSQRAVEHKDVWEKFNRKSYYGHPEFGILPPGAPCKECVEILDQRKADERVFRSIESASEIYVQQSLGDMHYRKDGQWLAIEDKLKPSGQGKFQSDFYLNPVGIDANAGKSYIATPQGKIYFNQWSLHAQTAQGEVLLAKADWSRYTAGDDGVYITNIFKGIDAELRVYRGSVKTSFIMKKNEYGVFDQLIFRDEYNGTDATTVSFSDHEMKTLQSGVGKLDIFSGNSAVLKVNEAVIYPKGAAKDNILTAAYQIRNKQVDILVPYSWINDNIGKHELIIDPTVTGTNTLNAAAITGSRYNATCNFDSSCNYNLSVNIPAATTVTGISFSFTYTANAPCFGSDGGVKFSSGNCATSIFTNQSQTAGPTIMMLVPVTNELQPCMPSPSCSAQSVPFTMHFYRTCKGPTGCDNSCIGAGAPWIMTIKGKTVEFNDPVDPITYTSNNICVGDSIYVTTWASYGVPPYSYNWSFSPTGTPSLGTGSSTSITFPNIVNNTIYAIITDGCNNTTIDSLPITVNYAAVVATPSSDTICSGETTAINLTTPAAGSTFTWTVVQNGVTGASAGSGTTIAQTLTTTGSTAGTAIYTITPQNAGCIGTPITVPIVVHPPKFKTVMISICTNQLPYTWNGQTYSSGGTGIGTYTTSSVVTGCDSTTTLNLIVNPVKTATVNQTICASQLPYTWNGIVVTSGGNAAAIDTTPSLVTGCDSITTLNLNVVNTLTHTVYATICASALPYQWNGINVTAGGAAAATFTSTSSVSGCDSITTLNLTVHPLPTAMVNAVICADELPYTWNGQTITSGGAAAATYTTPSLVTGCDSTTTLNLTVNPLLTAVQNITICANLLPYTWNGQNLTAGGNAIATYTTSSLITGCDSTTTLNLIVNPIPTATVNQTICASQLPYTWNGITVTTGGNGAATYTTPSLITGCDSITTLNLTVNPLKTATVNQTICASQLPYTWNGITVTAGGNGAATYTTPSLITGCDSTTTLNLTVNPVLTATVNQTICANQLPFTWNGIIVNTGGANAATYTTPSLVTACDSTTILNLTVNPVLTAIQNITICASQLPYTWNGQTITAGGTTAGTFTMPSAVTGCDSITTLNLTVHPLINATQNISICINQLPYTWNGQTINNGGTAVATFIIPSVVTGCDSTTTLNLTVNPLLTAVQNITICSNQVPYNWNGIVLSSGGTAVATFTAQSAITNCDSTTTLNLTINPILTGTQNLTICSGQLPYTWNGQVVASGGNAVATFTMPSAVTGCDSTTTLNLNVIPALLGTEQITICSNQLPYIWNGITVNSGGAAAATFTTVSPSTNCDSITTLNLTVNQVFNAVIDTNICAAQVPFEWNGQSYSNSGNYTHTFTSVSGCDSIVTLALNVAPVATTLPPQEVAGCRQVYLNGNTYYNNTVVYDTLYSELGCDSAYATIYITVHQAYADTTWAEICENESYQWGNETYTQTGHYMQQYTTNTGCDSVLHLQLKVWPVSQVNINYSLNQMPCTDDTVTFTGNGAVSYLWKLNDNDAGSGDQVHLTLSAKSNVIHLTGTDEHSCKSEASVTVETKPCCEMMVPNAFTPNGDGLNDQFGPETIGNPREYKMMIFNRYGQLIFTSVNVGNKWDGTQMGKIADAGTYFYRIYSKCTNDSESTYKGDVVLIR